MDSLPFRLVRPMNSLTQSTLLQQIRTPSEFLTAFNAKLIQRYALLDYVDHTAMLPLLIEKARVPLSPNVFLGLRQTLQSVQRFPRGCDAAKHVFESTLLSSVLSTPPESLSSVEYGSLWSFAAQLRAWEDVSRLLSAFPLRATLPLQSARELRVSMDHMLMTAMPMTAENAADAAETPVGVRLLCDVFGVETALSRALAGVSGGGAADWAERDLAVCTLVGVADAVRQWPTEAIPDETEWTRRAGRPTALHEADVHQWLRLLRRVQSEVVPPFVRRSLSEAMGSDLWRCYMESPLDALAVFFMELDAHWGASLRPVMRTFHETVVDGQLREEGPPLHTMALVKLLVSGAFLECKGELTKAIAVALRHALERTGNHAMTSSSHLTAFHASVVAAALGRMDEQIQTDAVLRESAEAISKQIIPSLRYERLKANGSARCVATLLNICPNWTRQNGLEGDCHRLLREHAQDGFTHAQLQGVLKTAQLPPDLREIVILRATEVPER